MKRTMFSHGRDGRPEIAGGETHAFAHERYEALLREAEQYRLELRLPSGNRRPGQFAGSPIAQLLVWVGVLRVN